MAAHLSLEPSRCATQVCAGDEQHCTWSADAEEGEFHVLNSTQLNEHLWTQVLNTSVSTSI